MTIGGNPIKLDWTVNIASLFNLAMLLGLCITAVGSYYELKNNVKLALDYTNESKLSISGLQNSISSSALEQNDVRVELGVISTKLDSLQESVKKLEQKLP